MHRYLLSVVCQDQTGLVANITGTLFDLGISLGSTHFSLLGQGAEFSAVCEAGEHILETDIREQLLTIESLKDADISIKPFTLHGEKLANTVISHRITIDGGDHSGLIARLTEVFVDFGANIVDLKADKILAQPHNLYHIEIAANIDDSTAEACLATLGNTASSLGMNFKVENN